MSTRYVAFLRAVNVGGRTMKMADLREALTGLGLTNVGTVIQTGNAFFDAGRSSRDTVTARIEAAMNERFGFDVPTILRTCDELRATLDSSPLAFDGDEPVVDKDRLLMFLDRRVTHDVELPISSSRGDVVIAQVLDVGSVASDVVVELNRIDGRVPNSAAFVEKQLGVVGTARWLHTTEQILRAARES